MIIDHNPLPKGQENLMHGHGTIWLKSIFSSQHKKNPWLCSERLINMDIQLLAHMERWTYTHCYPIFHTPSDKHTYLLVNPSSSVSSWKKSIPMTRANKVNVISCTKMNSRLTSFPGSPLTVQMEWSDLNHEVVHHDKLFVWGDLNWTTPGPYSCAYVTSKGWLLYIQYAKCVHTSPIFSRSGIQQQKGSEVTFIVGWF